MAKLKVHAETEGDGFSAQLDNGPLAFLGTVQKGDAESEVADGEHHLFFFTSGPPGSKYTVAVTAPAEATFSATFQISPSMTAGRLFTFHTGSSMLGG